MTAGPQDARPGVAAARPVLAALAVLIDHDPDHEPRVLLVQRRNPPDAGLWGFPGGHVEPGETALAAAARELHEETGLTARPLCYIDNIDVIERGADGALALAVDTETVPLPGGQLEQRLRRRRHHHAVGRAGHAHQTQAVAVGRVAVAAGAGDGFARRKHARTRHLPLGNGVAQGNVHA